MASSRRRDSSLIWPGFVDAVTTLLMVLMFVLTIFTMMQAVLRDELNTQDTELDALTVQVAQLAEALGLERARAADLQGQVAALEAGLATALAEGDRQGALIASLTADLAAREGELAVAKGRITDFEAQVAALLVERDRARDDAARLTASVSELEAAQDRLLTEAEAMTLALAQAREEIDAGAEAARLAAARREALEALLAEERRKVASGAAELEAARAEITEVEAARLADAAALQALRDRLAEADTELTAMTLALEAERTRAEETLTLLAAANAARDALDAERARTLTEAETRAALLSVAQQQLTEAEALAAEDQRRLALLNEQVAALTRQVGGLQELLGESRAREAAADTQIATLGSDLNAALARVAAEERRRAELEEAERRRLEEEARQLERYRSEFFGQMREVMAGRDGVEIVGDRFVFSSEVLFDAGSADLSPEGQAQIANVGALLLDASREIPEGIDWVLRVDGHTDDAPVRPGGRFASNWELSQARALSVVLYLVEELGFPPERLAATGFGEYRPVLAGSDPVSRAANRRIELKLTER